jgi:hypothetical protein
MIAPNAKTETWQNYGKIQFKHQDSSSVQVARPPEK